MCGVVDMREWLSSLEMWETVAFESEKRSSDCGDKRDLTEGSLMRSMNVLNTFDLPFFFSVP